METYEYGELHILSALRGDNRSLTTDAFVGVFGSSPMYVEVNGQKLAVFDLLGRSGWIIDAGAYHAPTGVDNTIIHMLRAADEKITYAQLHGRHFMRRRTGSGQDQ
jgi:hypothetical protein